MTLLIGYQNFSVLCTSLHVMYKLFLSMFIFKIWTVCVKDWNSFIFLMFSWGTAQKIWKYIDSVWNWEDKQWNDVECSFEHFTVAWGKFIQTGTFDSHAHFETWFCHTGSTNTSAWFVDTFNQSQTTSVISWIWKNTTTSVYMKEHNYQWIWKTQLPVWFHEYERTHSFSEEWVNNYWWGW